MTTDLRLPRRIFLAGCSCVGKSTVGRLLANQISVGFFDLDDAIEDFFGATLGQVQERLLDAFHAGTAAVLRDMVWLAGSGDYVVALTGFPSSYVREAIGEVKDAIVVVLVDAPEAIVERITDTGGRPMRGNLTADEKSYYLDVLRRDTASFAELFHGARFVDVAGLSPAEAAGRVKDVILSVGHYA